MFHFWLRYPSIIICQELQREKDKSKETEKLVGTTQNYNTADIPTYSQIEQQRQQKQQQQQQQQQPQLQQETK